MLVSLFLILFVLHLYRDKCLLHYYLDLLGSFSNYFDSVLLYINRISLFVTKIYISKYITYFTHCIKYCPLNIYHMWYIEYILYLYIVINVLHHLHFGGKHYCFFLKNFYGAFITCLFRLKSYFYSHDFQCGHLLSYHKYVYKWVYYKILSFYNF